MHTLVVPGQSTAVLFQLGWADLEIRPEFKFRIRFSFFSHYLASYPSVVHTTTSLRMYPYFTSACCIPLILFLFSFPIFYTFELETNLYKMNPTTRSKYQTRKLAAAALLLASTSQLMSTMNTVYAAAIPSKINEIDPLLITDTSFSPLSKRSLGAGLTLEPTTTGSSDALDEDLNDLLKRSLLDVELERRSPNGTGK